MHCIPLPIPQFIFIMLNPPSLSEMMCEPNGLDILLIDVMFSRILIAAHFCLPLPLAQRNIFETESRWGCNWSLFQHNFAIKEKHANLFSTHDGNLSTPKREIQINHEAAIQLQIRMGEYWIWTMKNKDKMAYCCATLTGGATPVHVTPPPTPFKWCRTSYPQDCTSVDEGGYF